MEKLAYGDGFDCSCGRHWDTNQIPRRDFEAVEAVARRFRRNQAVFVATVVALVVALVILGRSAPLLVTLPVSALVWLRFFRPWWRQRRLAALANLPTWDLRPD